jgi:hypothetical protein
LPQRAFENGLIFVLSTFALAVPIAKKMHGNIEHQKALRAQPAKQP